jgi:small subunit ribosomal protein S9
MSETNDTPAPNETTPEAPTAQAEQATTSDQPSRTPPPLPAGTQFVWGTGRRKKSIARVRIRPGSGKILINKRELTDYFPRIEEQNMVHKPLQAIGMTGGVDVWANVSGGGLSGQAGAVLLGLARALARHMPDVEHSLRDRGLLTRDARMKERKKPGQPGARKHFQFSKR